MEWLKGEIGDEVVDDFLAAVETNKAGEDIEVEASTAAAATSGSSVGYIIAIAVLALAVVVLAVKAFGKKKTKE